MNKLFYEIISEFDFQEYGELFIKKIEWIDNDITLEIQLEHGNDQTSFWQVRIKDCIEQNISFDWVSDFEINDNHAKLLKYKENEVSLYFSENTSNPYDLAEIIEKAYRKIMDDYSYINTFMSDCVTGHLRLLDICKSKFGLFAQGPKTLILEYKKILESKGINCSTVDNGLPKNWNGTEHVSYPSSLKILLIGNSYFIGADITHPEKCQ